MSPSSEPPRYRYPRCPLVSRRFLSGSGGRIDIVAPCLWSKVTVTRHRESFKIVAASLSSLNEYLEPKDRARPHLISLSVHWGDTRSLTSLMMRVTSGDGSSSSPLATTGGGCLASFRSLSSTSGGTALFGSTGSRDEGMQIKYRSPDGNDDEPGLVPMEPWLDSRANIPTVQKPPPDRFLGELLRDCRS